MIINANTDLVDAYPLRAEDYARIVAAAARHDAGVFVATLSPPLAESLRNRGTRALSQAECTRIVERYEEGYADRRFTNFLLDDAALIPKQTSSPQKFLPIQRGGRSNLTHLCTGALSH